MRYNTIKFNDIANGPGIGISIYLQGCPHHCKGCFNPETWSFDGGKEFTQDTLSFIISQLTSNDIKRHLSILGGEPLCQENAPLTWEIVTNVKYFLPKTKIYIWTGYIYEDIANSNNQNIKNILSTIDVLIDGPYIEEERDITLPMRGSRNQRIIYLKQKE